MKELLASAARGRLESLIKKGYAILLGLLTLQLGVRQVSQREHLTFLSDMVLVALFLSVAAVIVSAWVGRGNNLMLGIHGAVGLLAVVLIPAMTLATFYPGLALAGSGQHWIWANVSVSAVSVAIMFGLRPPFWIYLSTLLISWQIVQTAAGVEATNYVDFLDALQDTFFVFFLVVGLAGMYSQVCSWASQVDQANSALLASSIDKYKVNAVEKEDQRINALIHDSVLHALTFAIAAKTPKERQASVALAMWASEKIRNVEFSIAVSGNTTSNALFRSLRKLAEETSPLIKVSRYLAVSMFITDQAAQAITGAALQAMHNAIKHSEFTKLELKLNSPSNGLVTVHIIDNGRGFRPERVSRSRIGIRGSILTRMNLVGGLASIRSSAGNGTTVSLRWPK
jgi:signal transduction histidine kinase